METKRISTNFIQGGQNYGSGDEQRQLQLGKLYYDENGIPWVAMEQADRCIIGKRGWKKMISVSDEVKAELAEIVKQDFISINGQNIPEGTGRNDVINTYLRSLPLKQRSSASWTLDQLAGDFASEMEKLARENYSGWKPGDAFDTGIFERSYGMRGGLDIRV